MGKRSEYYRHSAHKKWAALDARRKKRTALNAAPQSQFNIYQSMTAEQLLVSETFRKKRGRTFLRILWPSLFSPRKPLKIGIDADLREDLARRGLADLVEQLTNSLADYCHGIKYLATVAQGEQRFDLDGNPIGPIKTGHKAWAQQMLAAYERQDNLF
jgi:hypothetical protein